MRKGHIHAGITGGAFLFKTLLDADRQDLIFPMVNKDTYPSWGLMRRNGATAITESWRMDNSLCHSSYLYVGTWFIGGLAGIKTDPDRPGFQRFVLKPGLIDDPSMTWVNAHHDSLYGRIERGWRIDDDRVLTLNATVPPNKTATLYLPTADDKAFTEGGIELAKAEGLEHLRTENGCAAIELTAGAYEFRSSLAVVARR